MVFFLVIFVGVVLGLIWAAFDHGKPTNRSDPNIMYSIDYMNNPVVRQLKDMERRKDFDI